MGADLIFDDEWPAWQQPPSSMPNVNAEAVSHAAHAYGSNNGNPMDDLKPWAVMVVTTVMMFCFLWSTAIQYTYGSLLATLAMVEDESTTAILTKGAPANNDDDASPPPYTDDENAAAEPDKNKNMLIDGLDEPEIVLLQHKPITSSTRGTLIHLRTRTGSYFSRFRGLGIMMLYGSAMHFLFNIWMAIFGRGPAFLLGFVMIPLMLVRISLLYTHYIISEPRADGKRWYQRVVDRKIARKMFRPTIVMSLAYALTMVAPAVTFAAFGPLFPDDVQQPGDMTPRDWAVVAAAVVSSVGAFLAALVFVCFPVTVAYTRVQAALLPADETPIVPFDRTFGGAFVPESEGGDGRLSMRAAWKTFNWNGRVRVVKVYAKMVACQIALTVFGFVAVGVVMHQSGATERVARYVREQKI